MPFDLHTVLFVLADYISNGLNPLLIGLILEEPLIDTRPVSTASQPSTLRRTVVFYVRTAIAVGLAVTLAELGKTYRVWPGHSNFPSGHTTFAAAAATCVILQRGARWAWLVTPLALLMALCLVYGNWHTPAEVTGALVLGPGVAVSILMATGPRRRRSPVPSPGTPGEG